MPAGLRLYRVQGDSMAPALRQGDYVLMLAFRNPVHKPRRGDIVVAAMAERSRVKRVVGLPRERLVFTEGRLLVDGDHLPEPYLRGLPPYLGVDTCEFSLGADDYFLMGDNRAHSTDSRQLGPVPRSAVAGTVACRVWPPRRRKPHNAALRTAAGAAASPE